MNRVLLAAILLSGCGRRDRVVVGAKNFTESDLLAEIVAQQIERRTGLHVDRKLHLGGTFVCHQAITAGDIDLYVEYTGTAYTAVLHHTAGPSADSVARAVAAEYRQRWSLVWLPGFGFNNTFAVAVRQQDAERFGLNAISDLTKVAAHWHPGFGLGFPSRAEGY